MTKFSVGGEDDVEGPSSPRPKKQRTNTAPIRSRRQEQRPAHESGIRVCRLISDDVYDAEEEEPERLEGEEENEEDEALDYGEEVEEEGREEEDGDEGRRRGGREASFDDSEEPRRTPLLVGGSGSISVSVAEPNEPQHTPLFGGGSSVSVTLTDPEVLDCPICLEPLSIPVYQCENGHAACPPCCTKLGNKCPSCSWPIGYNRCRALEKVLESVKISCPNMKYGCTEISTYSKRLEHEKACMHGPCWCPIHSCKFIGSSKSLAAHFSSRHANSAKCFTYNCMFRISLELREEYVILQEQSEGTVFVLYNMSERAGNMVSVGCIGPSSLEKGFSYDLIARYEGSSIRLQSFMDSAPRRNEHSRKISLLIPNGFILLWQLDLELCIRKHHEFPASVREQ